MTRSGGSTSTRRVGGPLWSVSAAATETTGDLRVPGRARTNGFPAAVRNALLAACLLSLITLLATTPNRARQDEGWSVPAGRDATSSLPADARGPVSATLGAGERSYLLSPARGVLNGSNAALGVGLRFQGGGVSVMAGAKHVGLRFSALGTGSALSPPVLMSTGVRRNRVDYHYRGGLTEWYVNGPSGIEQGFTVPRSVAGSDARPLTLALTVSGDARASTRRGRGSVAFAGTSLDYGGLSVTDASGRRLHSWMATRGGRVLLQVATRGARYPLLVDPWVQQGRLEAGMGVSAAVSADGNTAVVGGKFGSAYVFTRSGTTWTEQAKLVGQGACGIESTNVAISGDGDTVAVGLARECPGNSQTEGTGTASIFARSGSSWTQQLAPIFGSRSGSELGYRVAVSGDGNTALISEPNHYVGGSGRTRVLERSGGSWAETAVIADAGETAFESVSLSADGGTALVGNPDASNGIGTAQVYTRLGTTWMLEEQLTGAGEIGNALFGNAVALSPEGDAAVVGGEADNEAAGAAWAFARSGSWSLLGKLTSGETGHRCLGRSVAIAADAAGSALVSAPCSPAVWIFHTDGTKEKVQVSGNASGNNGVGLSADAKTALVGEEFGPTLALYNPGKAPYVTGIAPASGPESGGGRIDISGVNLAGATSVKFGSTEATWFEASETLILATPPPGSGTAEVTVTSPGGTSLTGGSPQQYTYIPRPIVTKVEPPEGSEAGGTTVTITGEHFTNASSVQFGSAGANFTVNSDTSITATSPPGSKGIVDVTVNTPGGLSATSGADQYRYILPAPIVTKVKPAEGPGSGGTTVTITGKYFSGATAVSFGGVPAATFSVKSETAITAKSPVGSGNIDIIVTTPSGTSATGPADLYHYAPAITSVSPASGPATGGTSVTISGVGLAFATAVRFGSTEATNFVVNSSTSITATSPEEIANTVDIRVVTPEGTTGVTAKDKFKFIPMVTGLSPSGGPTAGGTTVKVDGAGFATGTSLTAFKFGATSGTSVDCSSSTECTIVSPAHAVGTVDVRATVNKVVSPKNAPADQFSYS